MKELVNKEFWMNRGHPKNIRSYQKYKNIADSIFKQFLPKGGDKSFIEVGCVPGRNMVYFARNFGYQVAGIDYLEEIYSVEAVLRKSNVDKFELIHDDFFSYRPKCKYDVVFSSGFVEHFTEPEIVFKKHCDLLRSGGFLIIFLPNMQYMQKILRSIFGVKRVLDWHNLDVMFPHVWKSLAEQGGLSILYCNYFKTFKFWLRVFLKLFRWGYSFLDLTIYLTDFFPRIFYLWQRSRKSNL